MGGIREGRWRCDHCCSENLGRFEACRSCGVGRAADIAFYLPDGAPKISDAELLRDAMSGKDWHCDHCGSGNKATDRQCQTCGNARDGTDKGHDLRRDQPAPLLAPTASAAPPASPQTERGGAPTGAGRSGTRLLLAVGLMGVALLALSFLLDFKSESRISALSWERSIAIERLVAEQEEGWSHPADAYALKTDQRIRSYETVTLGYRPETRTETERYQSGTETYTCGSESLGNGYFRDKICDRPIYSTRSVTRQLQVPITEQRPVYDLWYSYTVDRWQEVRRVLAAGGDTAPVWPVPVLSAGEREGHRAENYRFETDDNKRGRMGLAEWLSYDEGDRVVVVRNFWGALKRVEHLDARGQHLEQTAGNRPEWTR